MRRPYASACDQNQAVILDAIQVYLKPGVEVLEVGSGTGQHAVYFAGHCPQICWQTSDRADYLADINSWRNDAGLANLPPPLLLDVCGQWPDKCYDRVFTANSLHIMSVVEVEHCISGAAECLKPAGFLITYGPFNEKGKFTSESNASFDRWLKHQNPHSGIKDSAWLNTLADNAGFTAVDCVEMPMNNRLLIWQRDPESG